MFHHVGLNNVHLNIYSIDSNGVPARLDFISALASNVLKNFSSSDLRSSPFVGVHIEQVEFALEAAQRGVLNLSFVVDAQ